MSAQNVASHPPRGVAPRHQAILLPEPHGGRSVPPCAPAAAPAREEAGKWQP